MLGLDCGYSMFMSKSSLTRVKMLFIPKLPAKPELIAMLSRAEKGAKIRGCMMLIIRGKNKGCSNILDTPNSYDPTRNAEQYYVRKPSSAENAGLSEQF